MRAIDHFLVRSVEYLESRYHLSGRHRLDLERPAGYLGHAVDEVQEFSYSVRLAGQVACIFSVTVCRA
jgi:hypothetical protein